MRMPLSRRLRAKRHMHRYSVRTDEMHETKSKSITWDHEDFEEVWRGYDYR